MDSRLVAGSISRARSVTLGTSLKDSPMAKSVQDLIDDIRLLGEVQFDIVQAVRALINKQFACVAEEVKYGGILFTADVQFCGVFAYMSTSV